MKNKITRKECPELFENISDFIVDNIYREHRRNSNFYTVSHVNFDTEWISHIENYEDYLGDWKTNMYISDPEYGTDWSEITELVRIEKATKVTTTTYWKEVE